MGNRLAITLSTIIIMLLLIISSCESYSFSETNDSSINVRDISDAKNITADQNLTINRQDLALLPELFNQVKDSVVEINVRGAVLNPHIIVGGSPLRQPFSAVGSGFMYDDNGHIVTNYHVINGSVTTFVTFLDGNSYSARIIGKDVYSDLAVLQVDASALYREVIKPLPIANSSSIQVGQRVVAIGNPLGLTGSMSQGIISQTNRLNRDLTGNFWVSDLIQTDAAIDPGSSGGPLIDLSGKVLGVTEQSLLYSQGANLIPAAGVGLAISSNTIQKVVPQLIAHGSYRHAWLGIHMADVTPAVAEVLGLNEAKGVVLLDVIPGSPLDIAGIKVNANNPDVILGIDGKIVREKSDLISYLNTKSPGDTVSLKILRSDGIIHDIVVKLQQRPMNNTSHQFSSTVYRYLQPPPPPKTVIR